MKQDHQRRKRKASKRWKRLKKKRTLFELIRSSRAKSTLCTLACKFQVTTSTLRTTLTSCACWCIREACPSCTPSLQFGSSFCTGCTKACCWSITKRPLASTKNYHCSQRYSLRWELFCISFSLLSCWLTAIWSHLKLQMLSFSCWRTSEATRH